MNRDEVIEFYKKILKRKFKMYGLEVVVAADTVVEKYKEEKGLFEPFARMVLNNTISNLKRKEEYHYQLSESWDEADVRPTEDYILAKVDIVSACGERNYAIYHDNIVKGLPVRTVAEVYNISPMGVRTVVQKVERFLEKHYGH
ncbi:MAG: sigma-70 family RNA polymerase sigma factor [Chitinophagaceae bacterium]|nr:sigma-70 family RNA polymerase sigma factor [Chitinophagaceae bacterium]